MLDTNLVDAFSYNLNRYSTGSTMLLQAIQFMNGPSYEVIIVGEMKKSLEIIKFVQKHPQPNKVVIFKNYKIEDKELPYLNFYTSNKNGNPWLNSKTIKFWDYNKI